MTLVEPEIWRMNLLDSLQQKNVATYLEEVLNTDATEDTDAVGCY